ncbi:MAG: AsnC family transcriptional regulator [Nitrososphaeraceae archaeon]
MGGTLDQLDIEIIRVLIQDSRTSYRMVSRAVGLSTNATKTRMKRLVSNGIILQYFTTINLSVFGYSKVCYIFLRTGNKVELILSRLKRLGNLVIEVHGDGGVSMLGIAIKPEEERKIRSFTKELKPILIQNIFIGQSSPIKLKLRRTDFMIMRCLLGNARMEVSDIAKRISTSPKSVSNRLAKMKENRLMMFNVATDPLKMNGYIRFGMVIWLERKDQKTIRRIQEILDRCFAIVLPMINQEEVINYQIVVNSIFDIDSALSEIRSLDAVKAAEVFIPYKAKIHQDWILWEIDKRINPQEAFLP